MLLIPAIGLVWLLAIGAGLCFLYVDRPTQWSVLGPALLWGAYYGLQPPGRAGLRTLPAAKPVVIALAWTWVTIWLPARQLLWPMFAARATFIFALALAYDLADLAIGYFPAVLAGLTAQAQAGESVTYQHQRLYDSDYVCVMQRKHPLADEPLTLDRFCAARHLLVSFSGRPFGFVDEALAGLGRQRQIVLTVNQFFTAGRVVANSRLLTVLPRHFVSVTGFADQLVLRELPFVVPPVHVDALWHRRLQQDSGHAWLRGIIAQLPHQSRLESLAPNATIAG